MAINWRNDEELKEFLEKAENMAKGDEFEKLKRRSWKGTGPLPMVKSRYDKMFK